MAELLSGLHMNEAVRDPIWKHIYFTSELFETTKTTAFVRLSRIKQLGPAELVYPGAVHTRSVHSFGVYRLSVLLLEKLLEKGASWVTKTGVSSFLAAALFHDLGHFPYAHSLKELPLTDHETLTARLVLAEPLNFLAAKSGADPQQTAAIIDTQLPTSDTETLFFRKLLSGVLDPDKLDYLNRDAYFCGVPYGIQDTDFILSRLIPDRERGIVLESNAILAVENILFSKYLMYRAVYWHKNVRAATAMMKKSLYSSLLAKTITEEELYDLNDESLFQLLQKNDCDAHKPAIAVKNHNIYQIIAEIPFNETCALHLELETYLKRNEAEYHLCEKAGIPFYDLVIDIPERISFESSLWIADEKCSFSASSTIFTADTVASFTKSLRKIRLAVNSAHKQQKQKVLIAEFMNLYYTEASGGSHDCP